MSYNKNRNGFETKDGGLIRINGSGDKIRIDVYSGNERAKEGHTRDSITFDTKSGKGRIDSHNKDKSEKSSKDISCYLTTACMKHFQDTFDDNCYELEILRWFRDNFVKNEDIYHYYQIAPIIVETIEGMPEEMKSNIYNAIYSCIITPCIKAIENGNYNFAYNTYKNGTLKLENSLLRVLKK